MLSGRLQARTAIRTVIGCFILFGSAMIARGLLDLAQPATSVDVQIASPLEPALPNTLAPSPAPYDPYAGASVPF